ncbi:hypothetical protein [Undibacterium flavidum]|uniref:Uncharacterized protein n=1 Tax=Undibacterium flavidum TaxID=2762297 RepID=A0ABR6YF00_9BURK|nr:hypothetical protein [Undibacterium flavidum]MBC3875122.1 hypothetical protein [Undibacterium flavidum]
MRYLSFSTCVIGAFCILTETSFAQSSGWKRDYLKLENTPLNFRCGSLKVKCDDAGFRPIYLNGVLYLKDEKKEVSTEGVRLLSQSNSKSPFFDSELLLSNEFAGIHSAVSVGNRIPSSYFVLSNGSKVEGKFEPELYLIKSKNLLNAISLKEQDLQPSASLPRGNTKAGGIINHCTFPAQKEVNISSFKDFAEFINVRNLATQTLYRCIANLSQPPTQITSTSNTESLAVTSLKNPVINGNAIREKIFDIISRKNGVANKANIVDALMTDRGILFAIDEYESSTFKKPLAVAFVWVPISIFDNDSIELNSKNGVFVDFSDFIEQTFDSPVQVSALTLDDKHSEMVKFSITVRKGITTSFYSTPLAKLTEQHNSEKFELLIGATANGHRTLIFPGIVSHFVPIGSDEWLLLSNIVDSSNTETSKYFSIKRDTYVELSMPTRK